DLEIVAQSVDAGQRLNATPRSATYAITLDVRIKQAGRYALRVGGRAPESIYPPGDPTLPFMRKRSELRVRLFVSPLDASGRAVFHDYVTASGSVGMPADARTTITVGAADARNQRQPYSAGGAPFGMALLSKPDVLSYDRGEGTAESAAFAAGLAALVPSTGRTPTACLQSLHVSPGGVLRLPQGSPKR
ncbi:MAG: S8 family serine peptidase, partial [Gemmataceae bacterium]